MQELIHEAIAVFEGKEKEEQAILEMEAEKAGLRTGGEDKLSSEGDCVSISISSMKGDLPEFERMIEFLEELSNDELQYLCAFMEYGKADNSEPFSEPDSDLDRDECIEMLEQESNASSLLRKALGKYEV